MITPAQLAKLIAIAVHLSGYPQPPAGALPEVHEIGTDQMTQMSGPYNVGLYIPKEHKIYIDVEWLLGSVNLADGSYHYTENSYMIHELVHWLQDLNGKYQGGECPNPLLRESQAYAVQNMYEKLYETSLETDGAHEVPSDTACLTQPLIVRPPHHGRERPRR